MVRVRITLISVPCLGRADQEHQPQNPECSDRQPDGSHDEPGDDSPHPHPDECPDLCRQEHSRHADDEEQNRNAVPEHLPAHLRCPPRVYFASSLFCHAHFLLRFCCALCCVSSVPHM